MGLKGKHVTICPKMTAIWQALRRYLMRSGESPSHWISITACAGTILKGYHDSYTFDKIVLTNYEA